jgi:general secretion pathway protein A
LDPEKPSLADDPDFLVSLPDLDAGLHSDEPVRLARRKTQRIAPPPPPRPAAVNTVASAPAIPLPELQPPPPGGRRWLLDLFPPAPPTGAAVPPTLPIGIAPPPQIVSRGLVRSVNEDDAQLSIPASYETFYGLNEKPFSLSTDPKFLYHSSAHDLAAQELLSAIRQRDGLFVLTGDIGIGKTTLCRAVIDELDHRTLTSVVLDPFVSLPQLLQTVLVDFGVVSHDDVAQGRLAQASSRDLIAKLREFVGSLVQLQAFAVVIIDEAQTLPVAALEEIRGVMEFDAQQRLLQIVLVGQPSLMKLLGRSELTALKQQIAGQSDLKGLAADEIINYVMHRITVAGPQARIELDAPAFSRLHQVTGGVPRLINLVCDRALALGYKASAGVITEELIRTAAEELDIAPPEPRQQRVLRTMLAVGIFAGLAALGAAGAAYVFREPLGRVVTQWKGAPAPAAAPQARPPAQGAPAPPK